MRELPLALAALLGWLPFLWRPLSPDEGGYLIVASQWGPGSSLYGDYWVDRPPVLIGLFALADGLGDRWALRLLGCLAVVATVLLAAWVGRLAAPATRIGPTLAAGTAALFTSTRLFGGGAVTGAVRAVPLVLAGRAAAIAAAATRSNVRALALATMAGAAGALAALTKQSQLDVFAGVLVLTLVTRRPRLLGGTLLGAGLTLAVVLVVSQRLGTPPAELWDAVVVFRGEAAQVIAESSTETTPRRFVGMIGALFLTAAPFVAVGLLVRLRGPATYGVVDLRWPAIGVLGWELVVVVLGGSFWLHYLMGLVPGLVLLAAAASQRKLQAGPTVVVPYAAAAVSTVVTFAVVLAVPLDRKEVPAIDYLRAQAEPGDTGVVAFGAANILRESGLTSPYEDLWSLPVRVRDPQLTRFTALLLSDEAPTWVVTQGAEVDTWGVDGDDADQALRDRYQLAATAGDFTIFRLDE